MVGNPVYAWDPNNDEFTYSLRGDDAELFAIDELTGQILVGPDALLDYEGERNIFWVEVVATDTLGDVSIVKVAVHLTDVILPEEPTNTTSPTTTTSWWSGWKC